MGRRILTDALRTIVNAEKRGFASTNLQPVSNVIASFLKIMKQKGYIKNFEVYDINRVGKITVELQGYIKNFEVYDINRVGKITVELQGRVNNCRVLTYRQDIKSRDIENYRIRALPTRQWGYLVISTPNGVLDHEEAIRQNVGGQVLGYFY